MDYGVAMARSSLADMACSVARTVDIVGERWTPLVLRDLFAGLNRFEDLRRDLGVAPNILAARLDKLERNAVIRRRAYQDRPVRHEYLLTDKGRELFQVLATIIAWGDRWQATDAGPPARLLHESCGSHATARTVCSCCGEEMTAENTRPVPGPGGAAGPGTTLIGAALAARADRRGAGRHGPVDQTPGELGDDG